MKITFKTLGNGKIASNNNAVLSEYIISQDALETTLDICSRQKQSVWDFLSHKKMFVGLPVRGKIQTCTAFVVRCADGTFKIWSNSYLNIEDNDVIFTTKEDGDAFCVEQNKPKADDKRVKAIKTRLDFLSFLNDRVDSLKELIENEMTDLMDEMDSLNGLTD